MIQTARLPMVILGAVLLLFSFVLAFEAYHQYPIMDGDAIDFLPHAISYAKGRTLIDPFAQKNLDATGQGRLVYHGFLTEIVTGSLCPRPTYAILRAVLTSINITCIVCLLFFLAGLPWKRRAVGASSRRSEDLWKTLLIIACLGAFATYTSGYGRPEMFAAALLTVGLVCWQRLPERWEIPCIGITVGLVTASNPLPGVMVFLISAIFFCTKYKIQGAIGRIILAGILSLVVFLIAFAFYPYPFHDWLNGMVLNGKGQFTRNDTGSKFVQYWLLEPGRTFIGPICLLGFCSCIFMAVRNWDRVKFRPGLILSSLILAIVIWQTSVRAPIRNYGLLVLTPIVFALLLHSLNEILLTSRQKYSYTIAAISILTVALGSISFLRGLAAFPGFEQAGLPYDRARADLFSLRQQYPGSLGMTSGLFTLTEEYKGVAGYERGTQPKTDDVIIQQTNTGWQEPPSVPGYRLVRNTFCPLQPRLFGVKVANTPQGYNYAFYIRDGKVKE